MGDSSARGISRTVGESRESLISLVGAVTGVNGDGVSSKTGVLEGMETSSGEVSAGAVVVFAFSEREVLSEALT